MTWSTNQTKLLHGVRHEDEDSLLEADCESLLNMGRSHFSLVCEKKDSTFVHKMVPTKEGSDISLSTLKNDRS